MSHLPERWRRLGAPALAACAVLTACELPGKGVMPPDGARPAVFRSDWSAATGGTASAVTDGGRWMNYWEFNNGSGVQLLSVAGGGPGGRNALRVVQRGASYAANVQQDNVVERSSDFYVRFYMRNDDTSQAGDHIVTVDTWEYANLTFKR
jgi:hypothetical protein